MNIFKYLMKLFFLIKLFLIFILININNLNADEIKKINIVGNDRISQETIKIFSEVKIS